jgi:long-subunit fatty acid transport protein
MKAFFILIIFFARTVSYAQGGQAGLSFLKLGVGARSLAMGEAATALTHDPSSTHYNPAGLRQAQNPQLLLMHKQWILETRTEFLAATLPIDEISFGLSLNVTSIPGIEIRQRPGPAEGSFTAQNAAIGLSSAYGIDDRLDIGLSVKYLYEKIFVDEAGGFGLDAGTVYRSPWNITFGASLSNMGSMSKLREVSSRLPTTLRVGAARYEALESLDAGLNFAADVVSILPESNTHLHLGAEFIYDQTFSVRMGYVSGYETRNVTAGVGFKYSLLTVDYAFVPFGLEFGTTHTFSLLIDL